MRTTLLANRAILAFLTTLFVFFTAKAQVINANAFPKFSFTTYKLENGNAGTKGAIYRFSNVQPGVDALVEIRDIVNAKLDTLDQTSTGYIDAFQPVITVPANKTGYIEWRIKFVIANTNSSKSFTKFAVTGIDIDGGADLNEFALAKNPNSSYVNASSILSFSKTGLNIKAVGPVTTYSGVDTTAAKVMIGFDYTNTDAVEYQTGVINNNEDDEQRLSSIYFQKFGNLTAPAILSGLPVNITNFSGKWINEKVNLNWTAYGAYNFSHFEIERSTDGRSFSTAAVLFADENKFDMKSFSYNDKVAAANYYYRLKMVDLDGSVVYSNIIKVYTDVKGNQISISVYPNPAAQSISIDNAGNIGQVRAFDLSGRGWTLTRSSNNMFDVRNLPVGVYFVKVGDKTAKFIKQ